MERDLALLSWIDNLALAYNMGRKSLCTATHTNVPLVILPDLDVFAGCIHLQQVPKLLLVHFQVGHSDCVVDQVILINEPEGLSHGSWDDALLIFIDGSWQREAQAHGEQGMSREPKLAGDRVRSEACLQHTSAGKEMPHNSPTAQPSQPGLHILQDLWAILSHCCAGIQQNCLFSKLLPQEGKKHLSILVSNTMPAATVRCSLKPA